MHRRFLLSYSESCAWGWLHSFSFFFFFLLSTTKFQIFSLTCIPFFIISDNILNSLSPVFCQERQAVRQHSLCTSKNWISTQSILGKPEREIGQHLFSSDYDYHLSSVMMSLAFFAACMVGLEILSIGAKKAYDRCMQNLVESMQNQPQCTCMLSPNGRITLFSPNSWAALNVS